ncbi:MAG: hypothetical protein ABR543_06995 [Gemmatimonadaceae bacterium]
MGVVAAFRRKTPTFSSVESVTSFRAVLRAIVQNVPNVRVLAEASGPLERLPVNAEFPHIVDAAGVEDATFHARLVPGGAPNAGPRFHAFLDGVQESRVMGRLDLAPIVYGTVAAAIRVRADRRLTCWRPPVVERRVYAPLAFVDRDALHKAVPGALRDTTPRDDHSPPPSAHPLELLERARNAVSRDRDAVEQLVAGTWCATEHSPLFVDGGIGASEIVARSPLCVGVVKSHLALYANGEALRTVLRLGCGERSSVFRIAPRGRSSVHSWYLRVRNNANRDALWGLVRIEVAESDDPGARADEVSRWVLAETEPNSMPDARWDRLAYGVRNCEEFLRAVTT